MGVIHAKILRELLRQLRGLHSHGQRCTKRCNTEHEPVLQEPGQLRHTFVLDTLLSAKNLQANGGLG